MLKYPDMRLSRSAPIADMADKSYCIYCSHYVEPEIIVSVSRRASLVFVPMYLHKCLLTSINLEIWT